MSSARCLAAAGPGLGPRRQPKCQQPAPWQPHWGQRFPQTEPHRWHAINSLPEDAEEPDWEQEMSIFKQRTLKPSQLEALRKMEAEKVDVGRVSVRLIDVIHAGAGLAQNSRPRRPPPPPPADARRPCALPHRCCTARTASPSWRA